MSTSYPCGSSCLAMTSALAKYSSSEIVQQKESYEFQPLGGVLACSCDDTLSGLDCQTQKKKKNHNPEKDPLSFLLNLHYPTMRLYKEL